MWLSEITFVFDWSAIFALVADISYGFSADCICFISELIGYSNGNVSPRPIPCLNRLFSNVGSSASKCIVSNITI